jgi:hypothetical protein
MLHQAHGVDLMDICAGGHLGQETVQWLGERSETMRSTLSGAAAQFFDQARSLYSMINVNDAIQALRNLTVKKDNVWNTNTILALSTIEQLQTANPIMQRFIMAEPRLRQMYLNNEVEGYSDTHVNLHGDRIGANHYDYRRVMDEVVIVTDDAMEYNHYYESLAEGDGELTLHEKVDILKTWNMVQQMLDVADEDPTSPFGNKLG